MTAISASSPRRKVGSFEKKGFTFSAVADRQHQAQRTRKVSLPVLLHHNESFSRLYKQAE